MTLALVAAIGVLVGWFGRPLWTWLVERVELWRMRRRVRDSPVAGCLNLASVAAMYKQMYAPESMPKAAMPAMRFNELRKHKFHVVGAIDSDHAATYPNAAAEVEAAVAAMHEELAKAAEQPEPMLYRGKAEPGEVVGLDAWIPKAAPPPDEAA